VSEEGGCGRFVKHATGQLDPNRRLMDVLDIVPSVDRGDIVRLCSVSSHHAQRGSGSS
jgi:hypothetical protein